MLPAYATCFTKTSRLILHFTVTRLRHCTYRFSLHFISVAAFHFKFKLQSSSPFSYFLFRLDYFFLRRFRFQVFFSRRAAGRLSCSVYSPLALQWQGEGDQTTLRPDRLSLSLYLWAESAEEYGTYLVTVFQKLHALFYSKIC